MQVASVELYSEAYQNLKSKGLCRLTNNFLDATALHRLLTEKRCLMHETDNSLLVFIPYHNSYYDCLYLSRRPEELASDLKKYISTYRLEMPIRLSIIGKGSAIENLSKLAQGIGFPLQKKLRRIQLEKIPEKLQKAIKILGAEWLPFADFARLGDEEEILNLLKDNFDLVSENIPEMSAISDNIKKKNILVIRLDGKIVAIHYFNILNNICYCYFDVTSKDYRNNVGIFYGISLFKEAYLKESDFSITRHFGWLDDERIRVKKYHNDADTKYDGIIIYNHLWTP